MNRSSLFKSLLISLLVTGLFLVGLFVFAAWQPPSDIPPNANVLAPINVGSVAQIKAGAFTALTLTASGGEIFANTGGTGHLEGDIKRVDEIIGNDDLRLFSNDNKNLPIYLEGNPVVINNDTNTGKVIVGSGGFDNSIVYGISAGTTLTDTAVVNRIGNQFSLTTNPAGSSSANFMGLEGSIKVNGGPYTQSVVGVGPVGLRGTIIKNTAQAVNSVTGLSGLIYNEGGVGIISNAYNVAARWSNSDATKIVNGYGMYIQNGTMTNQYGLYLENMTGGSSSNYAIYSAGGNNYFAGNVGIGTPSPVRLLHVNGAMRLTAGSAPASPALGDIYANSTDNNLYFYNGTGWDDLTAAGGGGGYWTLSGTNIYNTNTGNVGIGTPNPNSSLSFNYGGIAGWNNGSGGVQFNNTAGGQIGNFVNSTTTDYGAMYIFRPNGTLNQDNFEFDVLGPSYAGASGLMATNSVFMWSRSGLANGLRIGAQAGPVIFFNGGFAAANERMRIDTAGNVGIGTTGPGAKLDVAGTVKMTGFQLGTSATAGYVLTADASGNGTWQAAPGGGAGGWTDDGTVVRLTTITDNVGIGTASPGYKLTLTGGSMKITDDNTFLSVGNDDNIGFVKKSGYPGKLAYDSGAAFVITESSTSNIDPSNTFTDRLTILNGGNVGIGTASITSPAKLQIDGDGNTVLFPRKSTAGDPAGTNGMIYYNANSNAFRCYQNGAWTNCVGAGGGIGGSISQSQVAFGTAANTIGGNNNLWWDNTNSRLGIGTTGPIRRLEVASDGSNWVSGTFTGSGGTDKVVLGNYAGKAAIGAHNSALSAWTDLIMQFGGGNVGIGTGTAAPGALLSVGNNTFQVNSSGNLVKINNISYSWPLTQGGANTVLTNDASGNLSWAAAGGGSSLWLASGTNIYNANTGNVGIGTTDPVVKLEVVGSSGTVLYSRGGNIGVSGNGITYGVYGGGAYGVYGIGTTYGVAGSGTTYGVYGSGATSGVAGSGTTYDFYAIGIGQDYGSSSSIRWKRNIQPIDNALDKILNLNGVYFDWDENHGGQHGMGMIAEDVGKFVPEIVGWENDGSGYATGMDYGHLTPVLVEAIKEQQAEIEGLKSEIKGLNANTGDLEITTETTPAGESLFTLVNQKTGETIKKIGTFSEIITARLKTGLVETKKLVVDGIDVLKELTELKGKVKEQQQTLEQQGRQNEDLKAEVDDLKEKIKKLQTP